MVYVLNAVRPPPAWEPVVPVVLEDYKASLPTFAFHDMRQLVMQLRDPEGWQNIECLPTYATWAREAFMEEGIVEAHMRRVDPQEVLGFDIAVTTINAWINLGVTTQLQADKIARLLREFFDR
jgi:hypothetical protein